MSHGPFDRGDIVWMSFDPQKGHEQAGTRPALVMSDSGHNRKSSVILVCPITSRRWSDWPYAVDLPAAGKISGSVLVDHLRSIDWRARRPAFAAKCPPDVLAHATGKLAALIGATT